MAGSVAPVDFGDIFGLLRDGDLANPEVRRTLYFLLQETGLGKHPRIRISRDRYMKEGHRVDAAFRLAVLDWLDGTGLCGGAAVQALMAEMRSRLPLTASAPKRLETEQKPTEKSQEAGIGTKFQLGSSSSWSFEDLVAQVELCGGKRPGMGAVVAWVSAHLGCRLESLRASEVPGTEALTMLRWAQRNESEYRRVYDAKRVPAKGFSADVEVGFVDDGSPMAEILTRLAEVPGGIRGITNVQVRVVHEAESDGDVVGSAGSEVRGRGVHELSGDFAGGGVGADQGGGCGAVHALGRGEGLGGDIGKGVGRSGGNGK